MTVTFQQTDCPKCFSRPGQSADQTAHVPQGDGTYIRHRVASVIAGPTHDCSWHKADHQDRINRLASGNYNT